MPSSGDFPNPGIEPASLVSPVLAGRFFTVITMWEAPAYHTQLCTKVPGESSKVPLIDSSVVHDKPIKMGVRRISTSVSVSPELNS